VYIFAKCIIFLLSVSNLDLISYLTTVKQSLLCECQGVCVYICNIYNFT
jgi:hypothetical protein